LKIRVAPEAAAELRAAKAWYGERQRGFGTEFVAAIRATMARVSSAPMESPRLPRSADVQKAVVDRFPCVVVFLVRADAVHVLAVAHQSRHPSYWRDRAKSPGPARRR